MDPPSFRVRPTRSGLGRVPNEMLARLSNRRELAIHSEVITEPIVGLVAVGVITASVATN